MAVSLKHLKTSFVSDSGDPSLVQGSDWNAEHTLTCASGVLLGRQTAGAGTAEEVPIADFWASPGAIGGTTPAAGTFTTLVSTGQTDLGGATGSQNFRVLDTVSSVNFWNVRGGNGSTTNPRFTTDGTGTNIAGQFATKGTGAMQFLPGNTEAFRVSHTASAVNYVQVTGAATGGNPIIEATGSDGTQTLVLRGRGSGGAVTLSTTFGTYFKAIGVGGSSTVNYLQATASTSANTPILSAQGSDANIALAFVSKGTGGIDLAAGSSGINISNGGTVTAVMKIAAGSGYSTPPTWSASAPTTPGGTAASGTSTLFLAATPTISSGGTGYTVGDVLTLSGGTFVGGNAAYVTVSTVSGGVITGITLTNNGNLYTTVPTNPVSVTGGTGAGATLTASWGIQAALTITNAGSGYLEQPQITFSGGGGSGAAAYATVGSAVSVKSLGNQINFYTPNAAIGLQVYDSGNAGTGYWRFAAGFANTATMIASSAGANVATGGAGLLSFQTNSTTTQMSVSHTASAVNYVQVTGGATTVRPTISAQGSDTNVGLNFATKGTSPLAFYTNSNTLQAAINHVASAANYINLTGAIAGSAPTYGVAGPDTNINLALTPKGTGTVQFGTYTASVLSPTGYITITDSGGTTRRLLVG